MKIYNFVAFILSQKEEGFQKNLIDFVPTFGDKGRSEPGNLRMLKPQTDLV